MPELLALPRTHLWREGAPLCTESGAMERPKAK